MSVLAAKLSKLRCQGIFNCCTPEAIVESFNTVLGPDAASCEVSSWTTTYQPTAAQQILDAVSAGTASLDETKLQECIDSFDGGTCPDDPRCKGFITGLVPSGGECRLSMECGAEYLCSNTDSSTHTGTCILRAANNQICSIGLQCLSGYCFYQGSNRTCADPGQCPIN